MGFLFDRRKTRLAWLHVASLIICAITSPCTLSAPSGNGSSGSITSTTTTVQESSSTTSSSSSSSTVFTMFSKGEAQMNLEKHNKTAIFLLGNKGSGQTELAQTIIANYQLENSGEGDTSSYVPQYVVNKENSVAFYNFPGFEASRSAESDAASAYFMEKVTKHVSQVKFLFTVTHSSVQEASGEGSGGGGNNEEFDLMVTNAAKLLTPGETGKFANSIGLVITNVQGQGLRDEEILSGAESFLGSYKAQLSMKLSDGGLGEDETVLVQRKITFVEALLRRAVSGGLSLNSVWFLRGSGGENGGEGGEGVTFGPGGEGDAPSEGGSQGTTPSTGGSQSTTPSTGDNQGSTPSDNDQGSTPSGNDQGSTPSGNDQGSTPSGNDQGSTPPSGDNQGSTPSSEGSQSTGGSQSTTPSSEGSQSTTPSNGGSQSTTPSNGGSQSTTPSNGGSQSTTPSTGGSQSSTPSGSDQGTTPPTGDDHGSTPSSEGTTPQSGDNQGSTPSDNDQGSSPSTGDNQDSTPSTGDNQDSTPSTGDNQGTTPSSGNQGSTPPTSTDLPNAELHARRNITDLYMNRLQFSSVTHTDFTITLATQTISLIQSTFLPQISTIMSNLTTSAVQTTVTSYYTNFVQNAFINQDSSLSSALTSLNLDYNNILQSGMVSITDNLAPIFSHPLEPSPHVFHLEVFTKLEQFLHVTFPTSYLGSMSLMTNWIVFLQQVTNTNQTESSITERAVLDAFNKIHRFRDRVSREICSTDCESSHGGLPFHLR